MRAAGAVWPRWLVTRIGLSYLAAVAFGVLGWALSRLPVLVHLQWRHPVIGTLVGVADSFSDTTAYVAYFWAMFLVFVGVVAVRVRRPKTFLSWLRVQALAFPIFPSMVFVGVLVARLIDGFGLGGAFRRAVHDSVIVAVLAAALVVSVVASLLEKRFGRERSRSG